MACWCFSTKKYSLRIYLYIFKDIFRIKNALSITFEHRVSLDYQTKRKTFLETRINENNMLVEKMHICFKKCYCLNLVLSKWVMWHDTFWGRLQNRKNRRNGDGRLVLEVTYFIVIWQKGGNEILKIGNWKYQNLEWLRKTLISIFLSPPHPVQGWKKKYCSFSSERRWLTTRILFWRCSYLFWLQPSCTVWGHVLSKQRQNCDRSESCHHWQSGSNWEHLWKLLCVDKVFSWQRNHHLSLRSREEQNFITCK